jgi:hypothetical protein
MGFDPRARFRRAFFSKPTDAIQLKPLALLVDHPYPSLTKLPLRGRVAIAACTQRWRATFHACKALF